MRELSQFMERAESRAWPHLALLTPCLHLFPCHESEPRLMRRVTWPKTGSLAIGGLGMFKVEALCGWVYILFFKKNFFSFFLMLNLFIYFI